MRDQRWAVAVVLLGLAIMLSAMFADASVDAGNGLRVINLDLANRKLTRLLLGGIVLLAGVVLLASGKSRGGSDQTGANDEAPILKLAAAEAEKERHDSVRREVTQSPNRGPLQGISDWFIESTEPIWGRMATGIFVGLCLAILALAIAPLLSLPCLALAVAYAFRNAPSLRVQSQLHLLNVVIFGGLTGLAGLEIHEVITHSQSFEMNAKTAAIMLVATSAPAALSLCSLAWLRLRRRGT